MYILDKQASREGLRSDRAKPQEGNAVEQIPAIPTNSRSSIKDDKLEVSVKPVLDDVRELHGLAEHVDNAVEIDAKSPSVYSVQVSTEDVVDEVEAEVLSDHAEHYSHNAAPSRNTLDDGPEAMYQRHEQHNVPVTSISGIKSPLAQSGTLCVQDVTKTEKDNIISSSSPAGVSPNHFKAHSRVIEGVPDSASMEDSEKLNLALCPLIQEEYGHSLPKEKTCAEAFSSPYPTTPVASRTPDLSYPAGFVETDHPGESPQIGTSLLRRESLRNKESPSRRRILRKSKSPKKRETLQRRDTLQEREILQKVIAETAPDQIDDDPAARATGDDLPSSTCPAPKVVATMANDIHMRLESDINEVQASTSIANTAPDASAIDKSKVEKDLPRDLEAVAVYESLENCDSCNHTSEASGEIIQTEIAMDEASESIATAELDEATKTVVLVNELTDLPKTKAQSGARFSDDTNMLKDFLNRAQARKAAQQPILSAPDAPIAQPSPRRSPRKTHRSHKGNASTARNLRDVPNRLGTPPEKVKIDALDSDDADELNGEPTSCRRSARTRLSAPYVKAPPGVPSFIPVRRADGTDPVILQKSQAQELAIVTRANTRRNKGQSKPPLLALQDFPAETLELASAAKQGSGHAKSVGWAEELVCYQDGKAVAEAALEGTGARVRRLKGLGAVNGTPAPKRTMAVVSNCTPAPKRRGKGK